MKHLFLSELELKDYIPIFIELKDFNEEGHLDLEKLLLKKLNQFHNTFQEEYLDYALQSGCFLFLLDGYDELYSENQKEFFKKLMIFVTNILKTIISFLPDLIANRNSLNFNVSQF